MATAVTMNQRYHAGLASFKARCTDHQAIKQVMQNIFQDDVLGMASRFKRESAAKVCDLGCGDGVITEQLVKNLASVKQGEGWLLELVEPVEDYLHKTRNRLTQFESEGNKTEIFNETAEEHFRMVQAGYDIVFSSHSMYFTPLDTFQKIYSSLKLGGFLVVLAMSRISIMAQLKNLFHQNKTSTIDDYVELMEAKGFISNGNHCRQDFTSELNISGFHFANCIAELTEETKDILSLMLQRNVDDLSDDQYRTAKDTILERVNGHNLLLNNSIVVTKRVI
ncbi:MAG: class I SAM-dependent methyltransferase [Pseudomonadota bacterium]